MHSKCPEELFAGKIDYFGVIVFQRYQQNFEKKYSDFCRNILGRAVKAAIYISRGTLQGFQK